MKTVKMIPVLNCMDCPHCESRDTPRHDNASDYFCTVNKRKDLMLAGYVESVSELPQDGKFPSFCPFPTKKMKD